jgi:hypothetical protein
MNLVLSHAVSQSERVQGLDAASLVLCITLLALWMFRFTKPWVKLTAEAYALQLLAAAETLAEEKAE